MSITRTTTDNRRIELTDYIQRQFAYHKRKYTFEPYIYHLVQVANLSEAHGVNFGYEIGLAHDLYEDTDIRPFEFIHQLVKIGYSKMDSEFISNAVLELSNVYTTNAYPDLPRVERKKMEKQRLSKISYEAQSVKCADIFDNCKDLIQKDRDYGKMYLNEKQEVLDVFKNVSLFLHHQASKVIYDTLAVLELEKSDY